MYCNMRLSDIESCGNKPVMGYQMWGFYLILYFFGYFMSQSLDSLKWHWNKKYYFFHFSGSFYTTIALAFERLNAMKLRPLPQPGRSSPLKVRSYTTQTYYEKIFYGKSFKHCLIFLDNIIYFRLIRRISSWYWYALWQWFIICPDFSIPNQPISHTNLSKELETLVTLQRTFEL